MFNITIKITETVRAEARRIAEERNGFSLNQGMKTSFTNPQSHLSTQRGNWIGVISELLVWENYPNMKYTPSLSNTNHMNNEDFTLGRFRIELKTEVWRDFPTLLVHIGLLQRHSPDLFLFCSINNEPDVASQLTIHGYMNIEDVLKCRIITRGIQNLQLLPHPAHLVPLSDLKDFDIFYGENQPLSQAELMKLLMRNPSECRLI